MKKILSYFSLVKFSHTIFSLPFALTGFLMAMDTTNDRPDIIVIAATLLCLVFARNAAMSFNRIIDKRFDSMNPRTAQREIPSGKIHSSSALIFTVVNSLLFVCSAYFINTVCFYLSPVALLIILSYSYTKRISWICHFHLGLGLMTAPVGAYMAVSGILSADIFLLGTVVLFWVAGFDIIYAIQDMEFDRKTMLFSVPARFGDKKALHISRFTHAVAGIALLIWWALYFYQQWILLAGCVLFMGYMARQHFLIRPGQYYRINAVFFLSNGIASIGFGIFYILNYILY